MGLQVSIVFIKVGGISIEADDSGASQGTDVQCMEAIAVGQELMLQIQEIIYQAEGSVNKMMIDDKGQVILCVFGLNPYYHHVSVSARCWLNFLNVKIGQIRLFSFTPGAVA